MTQLRDRIEAADFRAALAQTEGSGELIRVARPVDPLIELPSLTVALMDRHPAPALLFEAIVGYPGWRAVCGLFADHGRMARLLGLPQDRGALKEPFLRAFDHPIPPVLVSSGPCQEQVITQDIDLRRSIPPTHGALQVHRLYYQTAAFTRHPTSGALNTAMYRCCVQGPDTVTINGRFEQHLGMQLSEAMERELVMPIALCIGVPPALYVAAATKLPYGVEEVALAGALLGAPLEMVRCQTIDLEVPASAEIVIEGEFRPPYEFGEDGPWPEYLRYLGMTIRPPLLHVKAITHRREPINNVLIPGGVPHLLGIGNAAALLRYLRSIAGEFVLDAHITPRTVNHHVIIQVRKRRAQDEGLQYNLGLAAFGFMYTVDLVILVDEDVNLYDLAEVDWAICTRCDPARQVYLLPPGRSQQVNPIVGVKDALGQPMVKGKMLIDATIPWEYRQVQKGPGLGYFTRSRWQPLDPKEYLTPEDQARWLPGR